jgi:hypothetical protein
MDARRTISKSSWQADHRRNGRLIDRDNRRGDLWNVSRTWHLSLSKNRLELTQKNSNGHRFRVGEVQTPKQAMEGSMQRRKDRLLVRIGNGIEGIAEGPTAILALIILMAIVVWKMSSFVFGGF